MVERRRELLGATTISHVHADDVHARIPGFGAGPDHVLRKTRTLKTVENDDRHSSRPLRLPVAMAKHLDTFFNLKQPLLRFRQAALTPEKVANQGLSMAVAQKPPRHKRLGNTAMGVTG